MGFGYWCKSRESAPAAEHDRTEIAKGNRQMQAFDANGGPRAPALTALLLMLGLVVTGCGNIGDRYERNLANNPPTQPPPTDPPPSQVLAAKIFSPSWARVGLEMELDGSGSTGGTVDQLSYAWSITSAPVGSTAQLQGAQQPVALFVPDVEGAYEFRLVVGRGGESNAAVSATTVVPPATFISRVQTGVLEWTDFNSNTLETIVLDHPVNLDRTLFMMTVRAERTNPRFARYSPTYEFIDDRTIEIRTGSSPNDPMFVSWTVVEFTPETVIGVQRGTVDRGLSPTDQLDIALAKPVDPSRSFVVPLLHQTESVHAYDKENAFTAALSASGATLRLESQGRPIPGNTLSQWQVIEFTADSGVDVRAYILDIAADQEIQRFTIDPVSPRNAFLMSGGNSIGFTNVNFPVRQAFRAYFVDGETIEVQKNNSGITRTDMRAVVYVVSVAGAEVYPYFGSFPIGSAFPVAQPSWAPIDRSSYDPVVMTGWNAFQFVYGATDSTRHTDIMFTVSLNPAADGVQVQRGGVDSTQTLREFSGFVVAWPRN
jgi:hypothetical protein